MDGENNGKPYEQMDDLGVPLFLETPILFQIWTCQKSGQNFTLMDPVFPSVSLFFQNHGPWKNSAKQSFWDPRRNT